MKKPASNFWLEARYAFDRTFKTGKRRAEFEHKYGRHGDYFGYKSNPYELAKYNETLRLMRAHRAANSSALEIGCSVGVFTQMIATEFAHVTAVDIASNALAQAKAQVAGAGDVSYVQSDVLSLNLNKTFDVIFCAEVLMYVREADAASAAKVLERHLSHTGIIVEVSQADRDADKGKFFHHWDRVLGERFATVHQQRFDDSKRPYEIMVFGHRR
jgi:SAM-dependent methyltransferase